MNYFLSGVVELAEPILADMGMELVQAKCPLEGGQPVLRLFIDRTEDGPRSRITLEDCADFSRALDNAIEDAGYDSPAIEDYLLEVSSPGLDRPLVKPADYRRFNGRLIKMKLRRGDKNASVKGRLDLNDDGGLAVVTAEGERVSFEFDDVVSCRLSLDEIFQDQASSDEVRAEDQHIPTAQENV